MNFNRCTTHITPKLLSKAVTAKANIWLQGRRTRGAKEAGVPVLKILGGAPPTVAGRLFGKDHHSYIDLNWSRPCNSSQ